jgi:hypothetical protein
MTSPSAVDALSASSKAALPEAQASVGTHRTRAAARLFTAAVDAKAGSPVASTPADVVPEAGASRVYRGSKTGELSPEKQFESFMLRSFVEEMLPSENSAFFGDGTAGNIWKSMLAERIGEEMAAAGGIGIAEMIGKHNADRARAAGQTLAAEASAATSATAKGGLDGL